MELEQFQSIRVATVDLNGQLRGKRLPASYASKLPKGQVRMPLSIMNVDIWGNDIEDSKLVFETGDADGILLPTNRGPVPMPWLNNHSALVPMSMHVEDGTPFFGDPREALNIVLSRFAKKGWHVLASTEMEFTLVDDRNSKLRPPINPRSNRRIFASDVLSLDELDAFDAFFSDLHRGAEAMNIPIQTMTSECGLGQFEVTLSHQGAMRAADDATLFKILARGIARKHSMAATFMAKPYQEDAGNGMHLHFSVVDENGTNIFDNGGSEGTEFLQQALAGCITAMRASTLIFAPHGPSYNRFEHGSHAPTNVCWGYENRTAALRVPGGLPSARRIEHRTAGGDINPYLMLAAVLGAAIEGIEVGLKPVPPITGSAYDQDLPQLMTDWVSAIDLIESDVFVARCLPKGLIQNFVMTKRQEIRFLANISEPDQWKTYLERV